MSVEPVHPLCPAKSARRRPGERLRAELQEMAQGHAELVNHRERAWASITFSGTRHSILLRFSGNAAVEAGEKFITALPDHEFAISGQLVADAVIASVEHELLPQPQIQVECELLLLLDG